MCLWDRKEAAATGREQRCGDRGRDGVCATAGHAGCHTLLLLQEGQAALWALGQAGDVSRVHPAQPPHPLLWTILSPALARFLVPVALALQGPSFGPGPFPVAPRPVANLLLPPPPPSTLPPPPRKSEFVVEVKSDKLPEEMGLLQGGGQDQRAPGQQVGGGLGWGDQGLALPQGATRPDT